MSNSVPRPGSQDALKFAPGSRAGRARPEPLWRQILGERLRRIRLEQGLTLEVVAARAGVSQQYLSEIERGQKEPSSEVIAAVVAALGLALVDLTLDIAEALILTQVAVSSPAVARRSDFMLAA